MTRPTTRRHLLHITRPAMACQFELVFNAGQYAHAAQAAVEALDLVDTLEEQLSFFRATSQLSRLNLVGADGPVEVDTDLFNLVQMALRLHEETAGAFDITMAPLWEAWGFARREGSLPSAESLAEAMKLVGSGHVKLDNQRRTIHFAKAGIRLNLGSVGKGYALDRAAEVLANRGIGDYLFHGGQSSVLARGSRAGGDTAVPGESSPGWVVGVRHPLRPRQRLAEICLRDQALGTSGSTMQYFRHRGRRYAHILDPRTGRPAEGVLSVTVVAPTAALADGLSTALFVMGPEPARAYCSRRPDVAALLACPAGDAGRLAIHALGFRGDELRLLDNA
jgi:thiamine biosynthesis lipoprotein